MPRRKRPANPAKVAVGLRFAMLTVTGRARRGAKLLWTVRCDCGRETVMQAGSIQRNVSCGCQSKRLLSKARTTHGMAKLRAPTYIVWMSMRYRCEKPTHKSYKDYGGRGIRVCDRWQRFENFLADMGEAPAGMQLDRVDNSSGYSPENCRWATPRQNSNNKRSNHFLEFEDQRLTLAQWSRTLGIPRDTLSNRIRSGWNVANVLTKPVRQMKNNASVAA